MNDTELKKIEHELARLAMANSHTAAMIHEGEIRNMVRSLCIERRDLRRQLAKMQAEMQQIQHMAAEEIRLGTAEGTFLYQIEANARAASKGSE